MIEQTHDAFVVEVRNVILILLDTELYLISLAIPAQNFIRISLMQPPVE
jgi:hypothetical protein